MSLNVSAVLNNTLSWSVLDTGTISQGLNVVDNSQLSSREVFTTGTGTQNVVDTVFYAANNFSINKIYDLYALDKNILGYESIANLSGVNIKCLVFKNTSTGNNQVDIYFSGVGGNHFNNFLLGQSAVKLRKNGVFIISDPNQGFIVDDSNRYITLIETEAGSARIEMAVIGQRV